MTIRLVELEFLSRVLTQFGCWAYFELIGNLSAHRKSLEISKYHENTNPIWLWPSRAHSVTNPSWQHQRAKFGSNFVGWHLNRKSGNTEMFHWAPYFLVAGSTLWIFSFSTRPIFLALAIMISSKVWCDFVQLKYITPQPSGDRACDFKSVVIKFMFMCIYDTLCVESGLIVYWIHLNSSNIQADS